jgi:uncharacterized protein YkwD
MTRSIRIRMLRTVAMLVALLAFQTAPADAAKRGKVRACPDVRAEPGEATAGQLGYSAVCLLNNERARRGMGRLRINKRLSSAALNHNEDMVENHYFEHESPNGDNVVDRLLPTGYLRRAVNWVVGENLAWGTEELATPRKIVQAWMRSPGHRHNILTRRFREVGIGVTFGAPTVRGRVAATYTTVFGFKK